MAAREAIFAFKRIVLEATFAACLAITLGLAIGSARMFSLPSSNSFPH